MEKHRKAAVVVGGLPIEALDRIEQFSETDFTADLKRFDIPTLFIHGDGDLIVPIGASAPMAAVLVPGSTLQAYAGSSHGIAELEAERFNADLLAFLSDAKALAA